MYEIRRLSELLLQAQDQQQLQRTQHEHQRLLLHNSCSELQSEVSALQAALVESKNEAEVLRAHLAEAEVLCPQLLHKFSRMLLR